MRHARIGTLRELSDLLDQIRLKPGIKDILLIHVDRQSGITLEGVLDQPSADTGSANVRIDENSLHVTCSQKQEPHYLTWPQAVASPDYRRPSRPSGGATWMVVCAVRQTPTSHPISTRSSLCFHGPGPPGERIRGRMEKQAVGLTAAGAQVRVIFPDESCLEAIGPGTMDVRRRPAVVRAAMTLSLAAATRIAKLWQPRR